MVTGQLVKCTWLVAGQWKQKLDSARGITHTQACVPIQKHAPSLSLSHTHRRVYLYTNMYLLFLSLSHTHKRIVHSIENITKTGLWEQNSNWTLIQT